MTTAPNSDEPQPGEIVEWFPLGSVDPLRVTFLWKYADDVAMIEHAGRRQTVDMKYISRQPIPEQKGTQ